MLRKSMFLETVPISGHVWTVGVWAVEAQQQQGGLHLCHPISRLADRRLRVSTHHILIFEYHFESLILIWELFEIQRPWKDEVLVPSLPLWQFLSPIEGCRDLVGW